jgi:D-3-phosphoglycerate dehydrogenase
MPRKVRLDRVALLNTFTPETLSLIKATFQASGYEIIMGKSFAPFSAGLTTLYPEEELAELLSTADVALSTGGRTRIYVGRRSLQSAERLRGIMTTSIGVDNIDLDAATQKGVLVCNAPVPGNYNCVAQHAASLILALVKRHNFYREWVTREEPSSKLFSNPDALPIYLDSSKTLGIIGLGRIGSRVARIFRAFDMRVLAYDPYVSDDRAELLGVQMVDDLETLLRESDVVSVHTFLSEGTRHLIGRDELAFMKKTAFIVNTSRGDIIDEAALIEALENHQLAGAGLDVTEVEPIRANNPLLQMKNVIITPHMAGASAALFEQGTEFAMQNVARVVAGGLPRAIVNAEALPKWKSKFGNPR